jgi:Calx-beta domain-containing protein
LLPDGDLLVSGGFTRFAEWPRFQLVRLHGGDAPGLGFFDFAESNASVLESAGVAQVWIRRVGATNGTAVVEYTTFDGSARAGLDYEAVSGSLTFAPGEEEKSLLIPIVNDSTYRGNRSFEVRLRDVTSGERGLTTATAFLDIVEDDPGLTFSRMNYWVYGGQIATNGTPWRLEFVERHGDLSVPLTVECKVSAGTAIPGVDFIPTNVTIYFAPNNFEAVVLLPLLPRDQTTPDRTVLLRLINPNPDISLATDSAAVLTILGPSVPPYFLPGQGAMDQKGRLRWACHLRPGQWIGIETSSNLVDWTYLTWIYLDPGAGLDPVFFEDPDAWKHPGRFYRLPVY